MHEKAWRTCRVTVLLFNLLPFLRSLCRRRLGILKSLIPTTSITNSALRPLPPLSPPLLTVISAIPRNNQQKGEMKKRWRVYLWLISRKLDMDSEAINLVKTSCSDLIYFTKFKYLYKSYSLERLKAFLKSIFKNTINHSIATMAMTTLSLQKLQISLTLSLD